MHPYGKLLQSFNHRLWAIALLSKYLKLPYAPELLKPLGNRYIEYLFTYAHPLPYGDSLGDRRQRVEFLWGRSVPEQAGNVKRYVYVARRHSENTAA